MDIWMAALGGGLGALLGALIGYGLGFVLPRRWRTIVVGVCAAALALVGGQLVGPMLADHLGAAQTQTPAEIEAQLLASPQIGPMAGAWKQSDPASYQKFLEQIASAAGSGHDRDAVVASARAQLIAAATPRFVRLPDAQLIELILVSRDEFRDLQRTRPEVCVAMFRGQPFGDITDATSASVQQRELTLMTEAFRADTPRSEDVLQGDALQAAASNVVDSMRAVVGDDVSMLSAGADLTGHEARFCEVAATFYDQMAALPEADAARLMRSMLAASRS